MVEKAGFPEIEDRARDGEDEIASESGLSSVEAHALDKEGSAPGAGTPGSAHEPDPAEPAAASGAPAATKPARRRLLPMTISAVVVALLGGGAYYGHYYWTTGRFLVSTDDAYVGARSTTLSPKVSGYIAEIVAGDNDRVKAGDVLLRIDDGDYRLAVQAAKDQIAVQEAAVARLRKQELAQEAMVE